MARETSHPPKLQPVVLGLSLALVAALAGVVLLWLDRDDQTGAAADASAGQTSGQVEDAELFAAGVGAEAAARSAVERMTTYTFATVEDDFTWVEDAGTDRFQAYFAGATNDAVAVIKSLGASATGTVIDSAPSVTDVTHVNVLLFVDQEITTRKQTESKLDQPRVSMQMVLQDGRWLVDEVAVNDLLTN